MGFISLIWGWLGGSALARGAMLTVAVMGVLGLAAWRLDVWAFDRGTQAGNAKVAAIQAALDKANLDATNSIAQWRNAAAKSLDDYLAQKDKADALAQQQEAAITALPGGDTPLSPYLSRAAGVLYAPQAAR